jgi:hypothetical protein
MDPFLLISSFQNLQGEFWEAVLNWLTSVKHSNNVIINNSLGTMKELILCYTEALNSRIR